MELCSYNIFSSHCIVGYLGSKDGYAFYPLVLIPHFSISFVADQSIKYTKN